MVVCLSILFFIDNNKYHYRHLLEQNSNHLVFEILLLENTGDAKIQIFNIKYWKLYDKHTNIERKKIITKNYEFYTLPWLIIWGSTFTFSIFPNFIHILRWLQINVFRAPCHPPYLLRTPQLITMIMGNAPYNFYKALRIALQQANRVLYTIRAKQRNKTNACFYIPKKDVFMILL